MTSECNSRSQNRERAETEYALVFALIFARCFVLLYKAENALSGRITVQVCNNDLYMGNEQDTYAHYAPTLQYARITHFQPWTITHSSGRIPGKIRVLARNTPSWPSSSLIRLLNCRILDFLVRSLIYRILELEYTMDTCSAVYQQDLCELFSSSSRKTAELF